MMGVLGCRSGALGPEHFDGVMAQTLKGDGWRIQHVHECLFDHHPTPQVGIGIARLCMSDPQSIPAPLRGRVHGMLFRAAMCQHGRSVG